MSGCFIFDEILNNLVDLFSLVWIELKHKESKSVNVDHHLNSLVRMVNALSSDVDHESEESLWKNLKNLRR